MTRNNIARYMDSVNHSGFHKNIKREFFLDDDLHIEEELTDLVEQEKMNEIIKRHQGGDS